MEEGRSGEKSKAIEIVWRGSIHLVWFAVVFPFLGSFMFLFYQSIEKEGFDIGKAIGSSLVGSILGLFFAIIPGSVTAISTLPFLVLCRWPGAFTAVAVGASFMVWFLVPSKNFLEGSDWVVLALIVGGLLLPTFALYRGIGIIRE